jgi:chromosome partitioning protein
MAGETMQGEALRAYRDACGLGQQDLANLLNDKLGRRYDRNKVSRWENGAERIPQLVAAFLNPTAGKSAGIPAIAGGPAVVAVCVNQKGGVGKTTSTVNIAYLLARRGCRVLVVDCDPQANASIHLGIDPHERDVARRTLTHVLFDGVPLGEAVTTACDGVLEVLPSSISLAAADAEILKEPNGTLLLREKLDEVRERYDFILIDCPPNLGQVTVSALNAADQVLIPSQTEMLSIMGIPMLLETLSKVRRRVNPKVAVLGILPTLHKARRLQDQAMMDELRRIAETARVRIFTPVKDAADYAKGVTAGRPTLDINPGVAGADSYAEVADALLAVAAAGREGVSHVAA